MNGDARKPVLERGATIEVAERTPGLEEGFLREVFDQMDVAFITVKDGKNLLLVVPDQFGVRVGRSGPDAGHEFSVVVNHKGKLFVWRVINSNLNGVVDKISDGTVALEIWRAVRE